MLLHGLRRSVCQLTWTVALVALVGAGCAQQPPAPPSAPTQAPPAAAAAPTLAAPAPTQPGAAPTPTTAAPAKPAAAAEPSEWVIGVTQEPTALDPNTGTTTRAGAFAYFVRSFLAPQFEWHRGIPRDLRADLSPWLRKILGFGQSGGIAEFIPTEAIG